MRVLFYTAAVIAAAIANVGQAVRLDNSAAYDCFEYAQTDAFNHDAKPN